MKSISINGTKRAAQEKHEARNLRAEGKVPCVLYGGKEQVHFSAPAISFKGLVYTPDVHVVDLNIDGTGFKAIMKDIQFHAVSDKILHIDFLELSDNKKVTVQIPVRVTGNSVGVRAGGQLITKLRKLKISALPKDLPDFYEVKIDDMNIGDSVRVRDIKIKGVDILDSPNNVIAAVKTTRAVVEDVKTAAPAAGAAAAPAAGAAAAPAAGAAAAKAPAKEEKKK
jgi:large subunit ribosomal protein L25